MRYQVSSPGYTRGRNKLNLVVRMSEVSLQWNVNQKFQRMCASSVRTLSHTKTDLTTEIIHTKNRKNNMTNYFHPCMLSTLKHNFMKRQFRSQCAKTLQIFFSQAQIEACNSMLESLFQTTRNSRSIFCIRSIFTWIPNCFGFTWHVPRYRPGYG